MKEGLDKFSHQILFKSLLSGQQIEYWMLSLKKRMKRVISPKISVVREGNVDFDPSAEGS